MEVYARSRHEAYKQNANRLFKQAGKSGEARVKHCEGAATKKTAKRTPKQLNSRATIREKPHAAAISAQKRLAPAWSEPFDYVITKLLLYALQITTSDQQLREPYQPRCLRTS